MDAEIDHPNVIVRFFRGLARFTFGGRIVPLDWSSPTERWEHERLEALDEELRLEGKEPPDDETDRLRLPRRRYRL